MLSFLKLIMFMSKPMFCIGLILKHPCSELSSHSNIITLIFTHKPVLSITVSYLYHAHASHPHTQCSHVVFFPLKVFPLFNTHYNDPQMNPPKSFKFLFF